MKKILVIGLLFSTLISVGQITGGTGVILDYDNPQKFEIGGLDVVGNKFTDKNIVLLMSGLSVGQSNDFGSKNCLAILKLQSQIPKVLKYI